MLLDNEREGDYSSFPLARRSPIGGRQRAVILGQVWSADLAEALYAVYAPWLGESLSLEDVSRLVRGVPDDDFGD